MTALAHESVVAICWAVVGVAFVVMLAIVNRPSGCGCKHEDDE